MRFVLIASLLIPCLLAACGGRTDASRETDDPSPASSAAEREPRVGAAEALEREITERARAAGHDSAVVRIHRTADGRAAVASVVVRPGPSDRPPPPADTTPRLGDSALIVGITRWDGVVAPFAAFERGEWRPVDREAFADRTTRSPIREWHFHARRGPTRVLRAHAIVEPENCHMYESWGQATDLEPDTLPWRDLLDSERAREWAGRYCPTTRIGIALSEKVALHRLTTVDTAATEARRLVDRLRPRFDELESDKLVAIGLAETDSTRHWTGHPASAAERARTPIVLTALRRGPPGRANGSIYHFVATRTYNPRTRHGRACPTATHLEGFILPNGTLTFRRPAVGIEGACSDSPGMGRRSITPYRVMRRADRSFLLALESAYESSVPVVYEITPSELTEIVRDWAH